MQAKNFDADNQEDSDGQITLEYRKEVDIMERKNAWKKYSDEDKNNVFTFADEYKTFISECKTERECVKKAVELAKKAGYRDLQEIIAANETLKAGDKVYAVNMKKAIVLFNIGSEPISTGMNILGAHIDSPRLDIKQNPMYEDSDLGSS